MKVHWVRRNPIFFERDGSFNPFFVLITALSVTEIWATVAGFGSSESIVKIVCVASLTTTLNIFVMAAVSQARAKIIAGATSTGEIAKGLVGIHPFGGSTVDHDDGSELPKP